MISDDNVGNSARDSTLQYKKSSLSSTGNCVEVAIVEAGIVYVRDDKDLSQAPLTFNADEWIAFIGGVKNGEFDIK